MRRIIILLIIVIAITTVNSYSQNSPILNSDIVNNKIAQIELADLSGKLIAASKIHIETSYPFSFQSYTSGIYILNFRSETINTGKKLFIRH